MKRVARRWLTCFCHSGARLLVLCALLLATLPVLAAERVALVIGNKDYRKLGVLPNAENDAKAMATQLRSLGFRLVGGEAQLNVSLGRLSTLLIDFQSELQPGDVALFYYAGHGAAHAGRNYLLPVPAGSDPKDPGLVWREQLPVLALDAGRILEATQARGRGINLIILDACRDNPLPARETDRTVGVDRGLVTMVGMGRTDENYQFIYAAAPGERAPDGPAGGNSPFTSALLAALRTPGLTLDGVLRATANHARDNPASPPLPYPLDPVPLRLASDPRCNR